MVDKNNDGYFEIELLDSFRGWRVISACFGEDNATKNLEALRNAPHWVGKELRLVKVERTVIDQRSE